VAKGSKEVDKMQIKTTNLLSATSGPPNRNSTLPELSVNIQSSKVHHTTFDLFFVF